MNRDEDGRRTKKKSGKKYGTTHKPLTSYNKMGGAYGHQSLTITMVSQRGISRDQMEKRKSPIDAENRGKREPDQRNSV